MRTLSRDRFHHPQSLWLIPAALALVSLTGCEGCEEGGLSQQNVILEVSPDPIVFEVIAARAQAVKVIRIQNTGAANLILEGDPLLEEHGEPAHPTLSMRNVLIPVDCGTLEPRESVDNPNTLRPGECRTVEIVFSPRVVGSSEGMLIFASNDDRDKRDNNGRREVPITAFADAPDIEVCVTVSACSDVEYCHDEESGEPLRLEFPLTQINESLDCGIRVTNYGDLNLSALGWGFTSGNRYQDFRLQPADLSSLSIQKNDGEDLSVRFTPVSGGARTGTITISSNDPIKPQIQIEVVGLGDGPKVCPDPMPVVDFGDVEVGSMVAQDVALENCGTMALEITDAWVQDATGRQNSLDYFMGPGAVPSIVLQPGENLNVPIEFRPRFAGQVNGRLYFASNDPIVPQAYVNLTGTGVIPPACELTPSTTSLSFGTTAVGYAPSSRTLAVTNVGQLPCDDVQGAISGGFQAIFRHKNPSLTDQPFFLDPGDTVVFNLEYEPQQVGLNHSGSFTITSPDLLADVVVQLGGTSVAEPTCNLSVVPRPSGMVMDECMSMGGFTSRLLQFGATRTGQTKTLSATLENVGSADCTISATEIKASSPFTPVTGFNYASPRNRVLVGGVATDTIRPGETGLISIGFAPTKEELSCGQLTIQTNDNSVNSECAASFPPGSSLDGCFSIQLRGSGVRATVAAIPSKVDFGLITIDCLSPEREVSIYNTGGVPVTVSAITLSPTTGVFRLGGMPPLPLTINAGAKLTLGVTYAPTGNPTTHTGSLTITTDAENSPTVVPLEGRSTHDTYQVDVFTQLAEPQVDVLWVIDDSCSMGDVQTNLRDNIHVFMQRALNQNTDFHMAVITTDWDDQTKAGRFQARSGWPRIIDRTVSDPVQAFRDNANVGTNGHHIEKGFDNAFDALTDPLLSGHNAGFLRDDAKLVIIFVSDEEEQSSASVDFFVDFFKNIKGHRNDALMSVNSIVGDNPGGCSNNFGSASAAPRYIAAANQTGGLFRSICAPDWGQVADDMGLDAFAARREFFLSREPIEASIQVQVNGVTVPRTGNWSYDTATNSIIFGISTVPAQGSTIRVSYDVLCRR